MATHDQFTEHIINNGAFARSERPFSVFLVGVTIDDLPGEAGKAVLAHHEPKLIHLLLEWDASRSNSYTSQRKQPGLLLQYGSDPILQDQDALPCQKVTKPAGDGVEFQMRLRSDNVTDRVLMKYAMDRDKQRLDATLTNIIGVEHVKAAIHWITAQPAKEKTAQ